MKRVVFWLLCALCPHRGFASDVVMGPLCVGGPGVDATYDRNHPDPRPDGHWLKTHMLYKRGTNRQQAKLVIFNQQVPENGSFTGHLTCDQIAVEMLKRGSSLLISGKINSLQLDGSLFESTTPGDNRFQIDVLKDVDLGYVDAASLTVAGGTVDLRGSKLWITNQSTILTTKSSFKGVLELTSWNRSIVNAVVIMPGDGQITTTLKPVNPATENVIFHYDLATLNTELWKGHLIGIPTGRFVAERLLIGPLSLTMPAIDVSTVEIQRTSSLYHVRLGAAAGKANEGAASAGVLAARLNGVSLKWSVATASSIAQTQKAFQLQDLSLADAEFDSNESSVKSANGLTVISGSSIMKISSLSAKSIAGRFDWEAPQVPILGFVLPTNDIKHVSFDVEGPWMGPVRLEGGVDTASILVGGFRLMRPLHLSFPSTLTSQDVVIPLSISAGPQGGQLEIIDGAQTVLVRAELQKVALDGRVVLTLNDLSASHLEVPATKFQFDAGAAVSTSPWLGSTKPLFGSATIKVINHSDVVVAAKNQSGLVMLDTSTLAIGDPVIKVGKTDPFPARLTLNASAGASFAYCMNRGDLVVTKGSFRAANTTSFAALARGASLDIGGTTVVDPNGSIADLVISVDRVANQGAVSSGAIKLNGSHAKRTRDPDKPNDIAFEGDIVQPLEVSSLAGTPEFTRDHVDLTNLIGTGVSIGVANASFSLSQAISLSEASVSLRADSIVSSVELESTDSDVPLPITPKYLSLKTLQDICGQLQPDTDIKTSRREYFTNAAVSFSGKLGVNGDVGNDVSVQLVIPPMVTDASATVSGRSDRLTGSGAATFSGFAGTVHSAIMTDASCEGGHLLRIPMNTAVATGGARLDITLTKGKAEARGPLAALAMQIASTGKAECEGEWHKQVLIAATSGWTEGICPTWSEPFRRCRWEWSTPEVSYEYRSKAVVRALTATVLMSTPFIDFGDQKTLMCNVGAAVLDPIAIIGGYYPEFRGSIPVVSDVANALVGVVAETAESGIATALGTGIGGIASLVLSHPVLGPATCIVMGVWR